jgi:hypothetical protein
MFAVASRHSSCVACNPAGAPRALHPMVAADQDIRAWIELNIHDKNLQCNPHHELSRLFSMDLC